MSKPGPDDDALVLLAAHAVRNHLSSLVTLTHILGSDGQSDPEIVGALRADLSRLALDTERLVDLARASADRPTESAPLADLMREAVRPLEWLVSARGAEISLGELPPGDADFVDPREVVAASRRLVAAVIASYPTASVVLEGGRERTGSLWLRARCDDVPPDYPLVDEATTASADPQLDLAVLRWVLARPGRDMRLMRSEDLKVVSVELSCPT